MASFQQVHYCKNCKTNVGINEKKQCKRCGSTQISTTWSVRFRYITEQGIEKQKRLSGFEMKKQASEEYIKFIANANKYEKNPNDIKRMTISKLHDEFVDFYKPRIKESTFKAFESVYDIYISPSFAKHTVVDLTPKQLLTWQNSLNKFSHRYKVKIREIFSMLLNYAERYYKVINQFKYVDNIKNVSHKKEMQIWEPAEFNRFVEKVDEIEYKTFFTALYFTGCRLGELRATTWNDWNIKDKTLNINKSYSNKISGRLTTPKNLSSIRKIYLPDFLVDIMNKYKLYFDSHYSTKEVFPLSESSLRRHKTDACKLAELNEIRLHDFRHSHASWLIHQGLSIVAIAKRLGHNNIEQTLNTYAHLLKSEDEQLAIVLNNSIKNLGTNLGTKK